MTFARGAKVKKPPKLTCNDALLVAMEFFCAENPGADGNDWRACCARAWMVYELCRKQPSSGADHGT